MEVPTPSPFFRVRTAFETGPAPDRFIFQINERGLAPSLRERREGASADQQ